MAETRTTTFLLLAAGALLYAAALILIFARLAEAVNGFVALTPLFGLPLIVARRGGGWRLALFLLLVLPAVHYLAYAVAVSLAFPPTPADSLFAMPGDSDLILAGAAAGVVGSAVSFAVLALLGLGSLRRRIGIAALGVAVLGVVGAVGLSQLELLSGTAGGGYELVWFLYLPWQIAFAFFLSRLLERRDNGLAADTGRA